MNTNINQWFPRSMLHMITSINFVKMMTAFTWPTLERRPVFCYVNGGGGAKAAPPVSPEQIEIFVCGFHQSVENHKHITSNVSGTEKCQATPTKIKMAAVRPDVIMMSWFERDVTKFPTESQIFWGPATRWQILEYSSTSGWLVNQRWLPLTGSTYAMSYISACIWDSNEIPTAASTFSGSSNPVGLL